MRKILFRGKDRDDKRWYEGYYLYMADTTYCFSEDYARARAEGKDPEHHYIVFDQMTDWCLPNRHLRAEVTPETVCEYTGFSDANHRMIFEQDIIKVTNTYKGMNKADLHLVAFQNGEFVAIHGEMYNPLNGFNEHCVMEVVGNAIDNPELLAEIPNLTQEAFLERLAKEVKGNA